MRNPNSIRPWQHVLEPLSGYLLLAENLYKNKLISQEQNWNFAPNISSCKSVKYIANKFAKSLNLKIKTLYSGKPFRLETDFLRLSNSKAKKYINWHPRWKLDKSLNKIIEWNNEIKKSSPLKVCQKQIKEFLNR